MKKAASLISILLSAVLLSTPVLAAKPKMTIDNNDYEEASEGTGSKGGSWKWNGDSALDLNEFQSDHEIHYSPENEGGNLTITTTGENYVGGGVSSDGDLEITGSGSLDTRQISADDVTIKDTTVSVENEYGAGIFAEGDVTIDNSNVEIESAIEPGIYSKGDVEVKNSNLEVEMEQVDSEGYPEVIFAENVTIDNSNVTLEMEDKSGVPISTVPNSVEGYDPKANGKITLKDVTVETSGVAVVDYEGADGVKDQFLGKGEEGDSVVDGTGDGIPKDRYSKNVTIRAKDQSKVVTWDDDDDDDDDEETEYTAKASPAQYGRDYSRWATAAGTIRTIEYMALCHIANDACSSKDEDEAKIFYDYLTGSEINYAFPSGHPLRAIDPSAIEYFNENGVEGFILRLNNESVIVVFAGTNGLGDLAADVQAGIESGSLDGALKAQYETACGIVNDLSAEGYKNIFVTGHSLGGLLAELAAAQTQAAAECYAFDPVPMPASVAAEMMDSPSARCVHIVDFYDSGAAEYFGGDAELDRDHQNVPVENVHTLELQGYLAGEDDYAGPVKNHSIGSAKRTLGSMGVPEKRDLWTAAIEMTDEEYYAAERALWK